MLTLYQSLNQGYKTFWEMVKDLDEMTLYPHALLAAARLSDFEALTDKLVGLLTAEDGSFLNEVQNGLFEQVVLSENAGTEGNTFYIYSVKPSRW